MSRSMWTNMFPSAEHAENTSADACSERNTTQNGQQEETHSVSARIPRELAARAAWALLGRCKVDSSAAPSVLRTEEMRGFRSHGLTVPVRESKSHVSISSLHTLLMPCWSLSWRSRRRVNVSQVSSCFLSDERQPCRSPRELSLSPRINNNLVHGEENLVFFSPGNDVQAAKREGPSRGDANRK